MTTIEMKLYYFLRELDPWTVGIGFLSGIIQGALLIYWLAE